MNYFEDENYSSDSDDSVISYSSDSEYNYQGFELSDLSEDGDYDDLLRNNEFEVTTLQSSRRRVYPASAGRPWTNKRSNFNEPLLDPPPNEVRNLIDERQEVDHFMKFFTEEILNKILDMTNIKMARLLRRKKYHGLAKSSFHQVTMAELKALIGLWLLWGSTGKHKLPRKSLFSLDPSVNSVEGHLCFSKHRYLAILSSLRFDDKRERDPTDKLAHIRDVFDSVIRNFRDSYQPGGTVTIDESIIPFEGKVSFRVFMPRKPHKYGMKVWCAVDPSTMYLCNAQMYLGKGDHPETNLGQRVVLDLTENMLNHGRTIITDNFFTSPELGQKLFEKNTHLLGTTRPNRVGLPLGLAAFDVELNRTQYFFRQYETIVKYQAKRTKSVYVYYTKPCITGRPEQFPGAIRFYNENKFGVDIFDELIDNSAYKIISRRWPVVVFSWLINAAAINAFVRYKMIVNPQIDDIHIYRRSFLYGLSMQLINDQKATRELSDNYIVNTFRKINELQNEINTKFRGSHPSTVHHCQICRRSMRSIHMKKCTNCKRTVCNSHLNAQYSCNTCTKELQTPSPTNKKTLRKRNPIQFRSNTAGKCYDCGSRYAKTVRIRCVICKNFLCKTHIFKKSFDRVFCKECSNAGRRYR